MQSKIKKSKYYQKIESFLDVRVFGLVAFGIVVLLVSWSGLKILERNYELEKQISRLTQRNQIIELKNKNQELENKYLQSDQFLELSVRRQLNKAKPGEQLFLIPDDVALAQTVEMPKDKQSEPTKEELPRYRQNLNDWYRFFFHKEQ